MIEHNPWIGKNYRKGGRMLWGFSHHRRRDEVDTPSATEDTIKEYALTDTHWFFTRLKKISGGTDPVEFWQGIAFANTLPHSVLDDNIYGPGSDEAREAVGPRIRRIIEQLQPRQVILFSRKGWHLWPALDGKYPEPARVLTAAPIVEWGSYKTASQETLAYNLPHPQWQSIDKLTEAVMAIFAHTAT